MTHNQALKVSRYHEQPQKTLERRDVRTNRIRLWAFNSLADVRMVASRRFPAHLFINMRFMGNCNLRGKLMTSSLFATSSFSSLGCRQASLTSSEAGAVLDQGTVDDLLTQEPQGRGRRYRMWWNDKESPEVRRQARENQENRPEKGFLFSIERVSIGQEQPF